MPPWRDVLYVLTLTNVCPVLAAAVCLWHTRRSGNAAARWLPIPTYLGLNFLSFLYLISHDWDYMKAWPITYKFLDVEHLVVFVGGLALVLVSGVRNVQRARVPRGFHVLSKGM